MSEWIKQTFGELVDFHDHQRIPLSSKVRATRKGQYPYYGAQEIVDYIDDYIFDGEYVLIAEDGANLITRNKPIATLAKGKFWVNNHAHIIRNKPHADLRFLLYLLNAHDVSGYITGSAQPKLSQERLASIPFSVPQNRAYQKQVADILTALDDKIELNRRLNDNLEAMAQALYDYWFVQFDFPDENGKPYKSSGGKMVWNEVLKREIPEGWTNSTVQDYIIIGNGKDHKSVGRGEIPCYGSGGFMFGVAKAIYTGESVLLPRKGSLNNVMLVDGSFWTVDTMFYSEPKMKGAAKYVYYGIQVYDLASMNLGTGVPSMTSTRLYSLKLVGAPYTILAKFDVVVSPLLSKARSLLAENKVLAAQRDFLLPLLMNGQVQVKPLNYRLADD